MDYPINDDAIDETTNAKDPPVAVQGSGLAGMKKSFAAAVAKKPDSRAEMATELLRPAVNSGSTADDIAVVQFLLKNGADPNREDKDGNTVLSDAASYAGNTEMMMTLIKGGAEPNLRNRAGGTPMDIVGQFEGNADQLKEALVKNGLSRNAEPIDGVAYTETKFRRAAFNGDIETLKGMLDAKDGMSANVASALNMDAALAAAAGGGRVEAVEFLLKQGANANSRGGKNFEQPLQAALQGNVEFQDRNFEKMTAIIGMLVEAGADPNAVGVKNGRTPLTAAATGSGLEAAVRELIERGAKVNMKDEFNETPLEAAIRYNEPWSNKKELQELQSVVNTLVEKGADIKNAQFRGKPVMDVVPDVLRKAIENKKAGEMERPAAIEVEKKGGEERRLNDMPKNERDSVLEMAVKAVSGVKLEMAPATNEDKAPNTGKAAGMENQNTR